MRAFFMISLSFAVMISVIGRHPALAEDRYSQTESSCVLYAPVGGALNNDWIPLRSDDDNHLEIAAVINNTPVTALLDTGSTKTILSNALINSSTKIINQINDVSVSSGIQRYEHVGNAKVIIGNNEISLSAIYTNLETFTNFSRTGISAIVGVDFLRNFGLELDLRNRRIRIAHFCRVDDINPQILPLMFTVDGLHHFIRVRVDNRLMKISIDTGFDGAVELSSSSYFPTSLSPSEETSIMTGGLAGLTISRLRVADYLSLNSVNLRDVDVIQNREPGMLENWSVDGLFGTSLLNRGRVIIDFVNRVVLFDLDDTYRPKAIRSTIGLQSLPINSKLQVLHVMQNSPADRAGWKAGDEICDVDGAPAINSGAKRNAHTWGTSAPGTIHVFLMCDGTERKLVAKAFY